MNDTSNDLTQSIAAQVAEAAADGQPLSIAGHGSKAFYGRPVDGRTLDISGHRGIVNYEPTELVLTARAGTPLADIENALAEHGQMLPFEPPRFGGRGTLGGAVATGLSGPRRPYVGAVRDMVLGSRIVNGRGEVLYFGGEVMKNVAGYDVSRLMTGAMGTLGVLLEVSVKLLPVFEHETTLRVGRDPEGAFLDLEGWVKQGYPISAAAHDGQSLYLRLSGSEKAVRAAQTALNGDDVAQGNDYWRALRDQELDFFAPGPNLWRIALPPLSPHPELTGDIYYDWGGQLCWVRSDASASDIRAAAERLGGHATLFRGEAGNADRFHPLAPAVRNLHRNLKRSFDPEGVLNPGRMYSDL